MDLYTLWEPFNLHIDQKELTCVLPTRISLGRSAHSLPPRTAATPNPHASNQINDITKRKQLVDDS